jgi:preprotein translocase SecE subunit
VARDRKRAKQRRDRQARSAGGPAPGADPGAVPAPGRNGDDAHVEHEANGENPLHEHEPAELASGEVDIAEAQLEVGRPDLADAQAPGDEAYDGAAGEAEVESDEEAFEELEDRVDEAEELFEEGEDGSAEHAAEVVRQRRGAARPVERKEGNRLTTFLRGSWRELQRVQWPDRRQVGQATAVVVGFVIVAGAFLGLMDYFATKIVDFIV